MKTKKKVVERPEATERVLKERRQKLPASKSRFTTGGFRKMPCPNKFAFGAKGEHERARDLVPPQTQRVLGARSSLPRSRPELTAGITLPRPRSQPGPRVRLHPSSVGGPSVPVSIIWWCSDSPGAGTCPVVNPVSWARAGICRTQRRARQDVGAIVYAGPCAIVDQITWACACASN